MLLAPYPVYRVGTMFPRFYREKVPGHRRLSCKCPDPPAELKDKMDVERKI